MLAALMLMAPPGTHAQNATSGTNRVHSHISQEEILEYYRLHPDDLRDLVGALPTNSVPPLSPEQALESLVSSNQNARLNGAVSLDAQRPQLSEERQKQLVGKLMDILNSTNPDEVKVYAVVVLGQYKASEAVPLLMQHFEWDTAGQGRGLNGGPNRIEHEALVLPVTQALVSIGLPAIPFLANTIAVTDDTWVRDKCIRVCLRIEGRELTQFRFRRLLEKESDLKRKGRIQSALEALE